MLKRASHVRACSFTFNHKMKYIFQHLSLFFNVLKPSSVETESDEYRSHNDTESDLEVSEDGVIIEDVNKVR